MREQRITIDIDEAGGISAEAEGFTGDLCLKDMERLLDGLGARRERVERKPDERAGVVAARRVVAVSPGKKP